MFRVIIVASLLTCVAWTQRSPGVSASAPAPGSPAELVKQGEKLNSEGKQDEALALYSKALEQSPNLYEAHLDLLERQGFVTAVVGIALPNEPSVALHEKLGFIHAGTIPQVGFKFGRWLDLAFYQLLLETPARPVDG